MNDEVTNLPRPKQSIVRVRLPEEKDWADAKFDAIEQQARNPAPNQCLIVAEAKGELVALALFSAGEYIIGYGGLMTTTNLCVDTDPGTAVKETDSLLRNK